MTAVIEINDIEELQSYRLAWRALHAETRRASYFQSLDWLLTYWKHFGKDQKLRVLIVKAGSEVLGILPLVVRTEQTRLGRLRVLTYPLDGWGAFYAPIGSQPTVTLHAALCHINATARDWDLFEPRWVPRDHVDHGRVKNSMFSAGFQPQESPWEQISMVELSGTWDDYWAAKTSKWRSNCRRCERLLSARGTVQHVRYRPAGTAQGDGAPRWDLYNACERIAEQSWQGSSATGTTITHDAVRDYLRDAFATAVHVGAADINLLTIDDEPVAFATNYVHQGYVYGLRMGYDADLAQDGAGTVLMWKMLEDSFARGDTHFDLGPAAVEIKRHWTTQTETSFCYSHYAAAPRAQALRLKRWIGRGKLPVAGG